MNIQAIKLLSLIDNTTIKFSTNVIPLLFFFFFFFKDVQDHTQHARLFALSDGKKSFLKPKK